MSRKLVDEQFGNAPQPGDIFGLEVHPDVPELVHVKEGQALLLTMATLGEDVVKGERAVLKADFGDETLTVCTLLPFVQESIPLDLPIHQTTCTFSVVSAKKTPVHLVGRFVEPFDSDDESEASIGQIYGHVANPEDDVSIDTDDEDFSSNESDPEITSEESDDSEDGEESESSDDDDEEDQDEDESMDNDESMDSDEGDDEESLHEKLKAEFPGRIDFGNPADDNKKKKKAQRKRQSVDEALSPESDTKKRKKDGTMKLSPDTKSKPGKAPISKQAVGKYIVSLLKQEKNGEKHITQLGTLIGEKYGTSFKSLGLGKLSDVIRSLKNVEIEGSRVILSK